ncbi:hypothetical protein M9Y10_023124 [Tritrichomonas musculus]|uniref:Uncharacterized protein n=1 Tax=Tritrichomonas musculus TaxID=1915356 RepID=A0ABR2KUU3_9EUKA
MSGGKRPGKGHPPKSHGVPEEYGDYGEGFDPSMNPYTNMDIDFNIRQSKPTPIQEIIPFYDVDYGSPQGKK